MYVVVCCFSFSFDVFLACFISEILDQVLAMFSYTAQNSDELTFYKGSVITVRSRKGDWWQGELNGKVGVFPNNYVQPLTDLPKTTQCKLICYWCCLAFWLRTRCWWQYYQPSPRNWRLISGIINFQPDFKLLGSNMFIKFWFLANRGVLR